VTPRRRALEPPFFPPMLLTRARSLLFSSSRTHIFTFFYHKLKICAPSGLPARSLRVRCNTLWH
jgi:hypothetical protein